MLKFVAGPAAGQTLMLRRAPRFLRVTQKRYTLDGEDDKWDGLDQLTDVANADEYIFAYRMEKHEGNCHMRFSGKAKSASGFYPMATYVYCEQQPDDATMRDNDRWREWCRQQPKP